MRCLIFILASLWVGSFSAKARSQPAPKNTVVAERLFDLGVADMQAGNYKTGCPLLAQSQQLDPNHGTLAAWADCEDRAGHLATAFSLYEQYLQNFASMNEAQKKRHSSRAKEAEARREKLRPLIPALRLIPPPIMPKGAKVLLDGSELDLALLALEIPVDPGEHIIVLKLIDGTSTEQKITLESREHIHLKVELPQVSATKVHNVPADPSSKTKDPALPEHNPPLVEKTPAKPIEDSAIPPLKTPTVPPPKPVPQTEGSPVKSAGYVMLGLGIISAGFGGIIRTFDSQGSGAFTDSISYEELSTGALIGGGILTTLGIMFIVGSSVTKTSTSKSTVQIKAPLQLGILQASPNSFMLGAQGTIF